MHEMSQPCHGELRMSLCYIHEDDYQKAIETVREGSVIFRNRDLEINDAIRKYCETKPLNQ